MAGYFGLISQNFNKEKIEKVTKRLAPLNNCENKTVNQPGFYFVSTWLKEKPLGGNFIFEDKSWIILFDGDLVEGPIPWENGGIPWGKILNILETKNYKNFENLRGTFSFAAFDKKNRNILLVTDRIGMLPTYYCKYPEGFCFTTCLSTFFCLTNVFKAEVRYLYDWLFFNYPVGCETPLQGVSRVERASLVLFSPDGLILSYQKYAPDFKKKVEIKEENEALSIAFKTFNERMPLYFTQNLPMGMPISAGLDTRTNLAFRPHNQKILTYTYGIQRTNDLVMGEGIAYKLGLPHASLFFDENIISSLPLLCMKTVFLSGGTLGILRSTLSSIYDNLFFNKGIRAVLSGVLGTEILRGFVDTPSVISKDIKTLFTKEKGIESIIENWKDILQPDYYEAFSNHIKARLREIKLQFGEFDNVETLLLYITYLVAPRYFGGEYNLARNWLTIRMPFLDTDIMNFVYRSDIASRAHPKFINSRTRCPEPRLLQAFLIAKKDPLMQNIRYDNITPKSLVQGGIYLILTKIFNKTVSSIKNTFISSPPLEDWDLWIQIALSDFYKRLLMSEDTKISEIIKPGTIDKLFNQPMSPIRTNLIGKLLTLEIIWRLVEGGWEESSIGVI